MGSSNPLTTTIHSLETGLETFNKRATEAASVCETFEQRLKRLGSEMKPLENSQRLALARKNLDLAIDNIKNVSEHFQYEVKARDWIRRGYKGADERVVYIRRIQDIQEVEEYFRCWKTLNSHVNPLERLVELRQEAVKACLAEFSGFVEGIGPSVEYSSQTDAYELVDIQSLECLKNALLWLDQSPELPCSSEEIQRVYAEKRAKLSSQLVNDFPPECSGGNSKSLLAGGSGAEDRVDYNLSFAMFLDFAVKHIIAEKLLLDRFFPKDLSGYAINSIFGPVTDILQRVVQHFLQYTVKSGKMAWERNTEVMVSMFNATDQIRRCVHLVLPATEKSEVLTRQFTSVTTKMAEGLRQSCIYFVNSVESDSETKRSFLPSNEAVQAIVSGTVHAIRRIVPFMECYEEIFANEQMPWDTINDNDSDSAAAYVESDEMSIKIVKFPLFGRFVDHVFQVLIDSLTRMHSPHLAGTEMVHLAVQQISCINNFCYVQTRVIDVSHPHTTCISKSSPKRLVSPTSGPSGETSFGQSSILNLDSRKAKAIMVLTGQNSPQKAAEILWNNCSPRKNELRDVRTEAINILYQSPEPELLQHHSGGSGNCFSPSEKQHYFPAKDQEIAIAELLSSNTRRSISLALNHAIETYYDVVLAAMEKIVVDDVVDLDQHLNASEAANPQTTSHLPQHSCRKLKKKFADWNAMWEGLCAGQMTITILNDEIMEQLRDDIQQHVLVPYEALYNKYHNVPFSRKHQNQYVRFSPSDVSSGINAMFRGLG